MLFFHHGLSQSFSLVPELNDDNEIWQDKIYRVEQYADDQRFYVHILEKRDDELMGKK